MNLLRALTAGVVAASMLGGGVALAEQSRSESEQNHSEICLAHEKARAHAPKTIEGRVMKIDPALGTVTVLEADGRQHEFRASPDTLQDLKVGDSISAKLRSSC